MSKRNFILLIIVLILGGTLGLWYWSSYSGTSSGKIGTNPGTNFISQFNPFSNIGEKLSGNNDKQPVDISGYETPQQNEARTGKLRKISTSAVAGFSVFKKERIKEGEMASQKPKAEFVSAVRYVEKATGYVFQTFADKLEIRRFSKTLIPKVHEVYFANKAGTVIMRYLKNDERTIETFVGTLPKENIGGVQGGDNEIKGSFLPANIKDISISPDNTKLFYLFENSVADNMVGTILTLSSGSKTQVFDSPFTEWLSQWSTAGTIALSTKPSGRAEGYMYSLNSVNKSLAKTLGGIAGLTTLVSPNGKLILYSDNTLSLYIYHTDTRSSDLLAIHSLPEKCVWGRVSDTIYCAVPKSIPGGEYPDTWYQGEASFNDEIWRVDVKTGNAVIVSDPVAAVKEEVDAVKLALDEDENYLFFINKKDNSLWELSLK